MLVDQDGFGEGSASTTGDFFLPGSPEEGFTVGYKIGGAASRFSNVERNYKTQLTKQSVTDLSSGDTLSAKWVGVTGSGGNKMQVTQLISFHEQSKYFQNTITLTNVSSETLDSVRYMRSFDPDQDKDLNNTYRTVNKIESQQPGDSLAKVSATGPVSDVPFFFSSTDARARVGNFGFANRDPYTSQAYDSAPSSGTTSTSDSAITITFDGGSLVAGASVTFQYYSSLAAELTTTSSSAAPTSTLFDTIVEASNAGTDTINSTLSTTLPDNVENLILSGTDGLNGIGNSLNNVLTGNSGANILKVLAGNDTLIGAGGSDALTGGAGADVFRYTNLTDGGTVASNVTAASASASGDTIFDFVSGTDKLEVKSSAFGNLSTGTLSSSSFVDLNTAYDGTNSGLSSGTKAFILDSTDTLYFDPATDAPGQDTNEGYTVIATDLELVAGDIQIIS